MTEDFSRSTFARAWVLSDWGGRVYVCPLWSLRWMITTVSHPPSLQYDTTLISLPLSLNLDNKPTSKSLETSCSPRYPPTVGDVFLPPLGAPFLFMVNSSVALPFNRGDYKTVTNIICILTAGQWMSCMTRWSQWASNLRSGDQISCREKKNLLPPQSNIVF